MSESAYEKHGTNPFDNPVDRGQGSVGSLPETLANPYSRAEEAERQQQKLQAAASKVDPENIPQFTPVTGDGTLVYIRHNRPSSVHVVSVNGDIHIPGRREYQDSQPPYAVMEAEQVARVPQLKKLFRTQVRRGHDAKVLEQISEEAYYEEGALWHEWAEEKNRKFEYAIAPRGTEDSDHESFRDNINWNTVVLQGRPNR